MNSTTRPDDASAAALPPREPLNSIGQAFYDRLPPEHRPERTMARFPHVINQLAAAWGRPRAFDTLMDDLLLAEGQRQGFPFDVVMELSDLRELHEKSLPGAR